MVAVKAQVVRRKVIGHLDAQLPIKHRLVSVVWAIIVIILLAALSSLVYFLSLLLIENQVSPGCDVPSYTRAPVCGYMLSVTKNASNYVRHPDPLIRHLKGNRCAFVIFSETMEVRISFANYSFQPSSNAGVIVAELSNEGGNELKYSKMDYTRDLIAKAPLVIYYTSDGDEKQSWFVIEVSPIESSGSSAEFPNSASMVYYKKTGAVNNYYPHYASYPMADLVTFGAAPTSQPGRHFTCSPHNSTCCNAISLYELPTFKLGGSAARLIGLSTGGVKVGSQVTFVMMFCLPNNYDASASGSTCQFEWHAIDETTTEVDFDY